MASIDLEAIHAWVDEQWESHALGSLAEFIEIPALSPAFDEDWAAHGYLDDTIDLFLKWLGTLPMKGMSCNVHRIEGRTPVLTVTIEGSGDRAKSCSTAISTSSHRSRVGRKAKALGSPFVKTLALWSRECRRRVRWLPQHPLDFSAAATQYCHPKATFLIAL